MSVETGTPGTPAQGDTGSGLSRISGLRLNLTPFYDGPGADGTPSGAEGVTPPAAAPSGGTPAAVAPVVGAPGAVTPPAARRYEYQEDRSTWVPPHRIREGTERQAALQRELDLERSRVAALSGVQRPAAPEDAETQAIRAQFEKLYPGLAKLNSQAEKLERLAELDPNDMTGAQEHYWTSLGQQTLNRVDAEAQELFGGGELTPFAKRTLHSAFAAFIQSDRELGQRYAAQDPKLVKDFFKEYQQGFLDPYRRQITTQAAPRNERVRNLPRGGTSTAIPNGGPAPIKPADTDEFHGAAFKAMTQGRGQ